MAPLPHVPKRPLNLKRSVLKPASAESERSFYISVRNIIFFHFRPARHIYVPETVNSRRSISQLLFRICLYPVKIQAAAVKVQCASHRNVYLIPAQLLNAADILQGADSAGIGNGYPVPSSQKRHQILFNAASTA